MSKSFAEPRSVLCIGNQPVRLNLCYSFLKAHGWVVLTSGNSHEGIQRFTSEKVHIVVIDLNHHESESALVASELKRLNPTIPVVMLRSEGRSLSKELSGCVDCTVNADDLDALLHTLESLI
jgi:DNA-binding NarL/FixJ family response regulator